MPLVSEARLLEMAQQNKTVLNKLPMARHTAVANVVQRVIAAAEAIDMDTIRGVLAAIRHELTVNRRQQGKGERPWDVDPQLYANLNRAEPWWGWEFELGYRSANAYAEAVGYAYDNFTGATFDSEGEGGYPVEITFPPEEVSKYVDGTSQAHRFITWNAQNAERLCQMNAANNWIGSHLNMSDPRMNADNINKVATFMNRTLQHCRRVNGQRREMFGRETLYGTFYTQASGQNRWLEFKGFRTTYDEAQWGRYVQTAHALQKAMNAFFERLEDGAVANTVGCSNLYDVAFNGAEPVLEHYNINQCADNAARLCYRGGGYGGEDDTGGGYIGG